MPFGIVSDWYRIALPKPEILSYPLSTNVLDSVVINATGVTADSSGPYKNRRYLIQGTILSKRTDNQYERYTGANGQAVAGVLHDTIEFADNSDKSDAPAAMVRRNAEFKKAAIIDYATYETALKAALSTCEFV